MEETVTKKEKKENAVIERLKKMATFLVVSGFISYVFLTLVLPNLQTVVDFWSPLFERTGLDKKFGVDPTGISGWIAAFIMTIVVLTAIAYLGTSDWGQKFIRMVLRRIPMIKNFVQEKNGKISKETEKKVQVTREQLRAWQPAFVPHFMGPLGRLNPTVDELIFIQGPQPSEIDDEGEKVSFRAFKPSWPVMFQGTPMIVHSSPDLLMIPRENFDEVEKWYMSGGNAPIEPLLRLNRAERREVGAF